MNDRELSRSSTGAFDDAASFFGAGGTTSDGGYASSGARGGREGSVTGGGGDFRRGDGIDIFDDLDDIRNDSLYSRSLTASSASRSDITDPLDDFLKRYTIDIMPEETVAKLKKRAGSMVFGVNYCPQWDARVTYTAKPAPGLAAPWWLHKLSYSPGSGACKRGSIKGRASSFSDDDDDDLFVVPLEGAAGAAASDASVSGAGSSVGGAAPSRSRSTFRALKSRLPPLQGVATLTSPKLDLLSWLRLQFVADADLDTGRCGLRWRVSTKWSASPGRIGRKERWPIFDGAELKPRWSVDLYTPEVTGTFGVPQRQLRGGSGGGGKGRRRRPGGAAGAAGGSANGGSVEDEAAAPGPGDGASAGSATDDGGGDDSSAFSRRSSATSFRGRRRGARGRAALDLGHCHLLVPRLDAVVDADAAALSLVKAAKFVAVTPLRVLAGIPVAAARKAAGRVRKRALPPPPQAPALPSPPPPSGAPFVAPGGLTFPPLPSFLYRSVSSPAPTTKKNLPQQFAVRGWPWSLGLADGLESAAAWLRRATEEAKARSSGSSGCGAANASARNA